MDDENDDFKWNAYRSWRYDCDVYFNRFCIDLNGKRVVSIDTTSFFGL